MNSVFGILKPKSRKEIEEDLSKLSYAERFCAEFKFYYLNHPTPRSYLTIYSIIKKINKKDIPCAVSIPRTLVDPDNNQLYVITIYVGYVCGINPIKSITLVELKNEWNTFPGFIKRTILYKNYEKYKFRKANSKEYL